MYAGLLIYSRLTRRFLLFTPRNRNNEVFLLGDNPLNEDESPVDIVRRVTHDEIEFDGDRLDIEPSWLVPLSSWEINNTMYHAHMILVEREFLPKLSDKLLNAVWVHAEGLPELRLHRSVIEVFNKDRTLQQLLKQDETIDYDVLIEQILHPKKPDPDSE
jgi:hypothetical protein